MTTPFRWISVIFRGMLFLKKECKMSSPSLKLTIGPHCLRSRVASDARQRLYNSYAEQANCILIHDTHTHNTYIHPFKRNDSQYNIAIKSHSEFRVRRQHQHYDQHWILSLPLLRKSQYNYGDFKVRLSGRPFLAMFYEHMQGNTSWSTWFEYYC